MTIRTLLARLCMGMTLLAAAGCQERERGPIRISAIGAAPRFVNPNLTPLDTPSALLMEATAQGLVRFDAQGQVEPALAQRWIVSDDGLRYTFRLARAAWANGRPVTAEQVAERLSAAVSRASRNPLKPVLGAIAEIEAMTDEVVEIRLAGQRANFLQLLAQPEMAIIRRGVGAGPFRATADSDDAVRLAPADATDAESDEEASAARAAEILLRGDRAALAVVRFRAGLADLVTGGTVGDLPVMRAAETDARALRFDPVSGLFGLMFVANEGPATEVTIRRALSMAVDRSALVAALGVPDLQPRRTLLPTGIAEAPTPAQPAWAADPLDTRRRRAAAIVEALGDRPLRIRVALPAGAGYRLVFAHLRRDWRAIGVEAVAVARDDEADVRLIDEVAPANLASWYLRHFECRASAVCSAEANEAMAAARRAPDLAERQRQLGVADRLLTDAALFIPLTAPVRWSLVSPRLTGFQPNPFGRHFVGGLAAPIS